jgi:hypothetical protein
MPEFGNNLTALVELKVWLALAYDGHEHHHSSLSIADLAASLNSE